MKTRKWYSTKFIPDRKFELIIRTDMGYVFEAIYENGKFLTSNVTNHKVYFEEWIKQESSPNKGLFSMGATKNK